MNSRRQPNHHSSSNIFEGELFGHAALRRWLQIEILAAGACGLAITAKRYGVSPGVLSNIVNSGKRVGPELALRFGFELHTYPVFVPLSPHPASQQSGGTA